MNAGMGMREKRGSRTVLIHILVHTERPFRWRLRERSRGRFCGCKRRRGRLTASNIDISQEAWE
jgi:hypothetical protein